jgi:hypothetical protein
MTRGQFLLCLATVGLLTGCRTTLTAPSAASSPQLPVAVHSTDDVKNALADGRVTRTLVFDGGQLRLDPPGITHPELDESRAIALVRSGAPMGSASPVGLALVGLARASLTAHVTFPPAVTAVPPQLAHRLVWMALTTYGAHSCPTTTSGAMTASAAPQAEPLQLHLVAADGSGVGVTYATAGAFCGRPVAASAAPLAYHESLPWRMVSSDARTVTIAADVPPCALAQGSTSSGNVWSATSTVGIDAVVFMAPNGCRVTGPGSEHTATQTVYRTGSALPRPEATGLNPTGMINYPSLRDFTYYDGTEHTIS